MKFNPKFFGTILIVIGVIGFIAEAIISFTVLSGMDHGAIPASAVLLIIIGMCFFWPTLLEESTGQVSTMRVLCLAVILVFVVIYTKLGWTADGFDEFKIDPTWVYVLGLAFGAKAVQKYAEPDDDPPPPAGN
jgi:hypothetical protein